MSLKRSDNPALSQVPAGASGGRTGWRFFLLRTAGLLLALPAVAGLGWLVEESGLIDRYIQRILILIGFNIILAVGLQLINGFSGQFSLGHAGFMAVGAYMAAFPAKSYSHRLEDPFSVAAYFISLGLVITIAAVAMG